MAESGITGEDYLKYMQVSNLTKFQMLNITYRKHHLMLQMMATIRYKYCQKH
jgi:ATP phosphoribosyltransferase